MAAKFFYRKIVQHNYRNIPINGIIFDMDGTLTLPVLNFKMLRDRLNIGLDIDILQYAKTAPKKDQAKIYRIIEDFEEEGLVNLKLQPNLHHLFDFLKNSNINRALLTRNNQHAVDVFLERFIEFDPLNSFKSRKDLFSIILTRDFTPTKPDPAAIHHICLNWGVSEETVIMVGDELHDITAGKRSGAVTILKEKDSSGTSYGEDFKIKDLTEIKDLLENSFEMV